LIDYQKQFKKLLKQHAKYGYLRDPKIQKILEEIPLELILDESQLNRFVMNDLPALFFYKDQENVRTMSAPHMISMTLSMLELNEFDKVLILGSKGGLIEAAIANIVNEVYIVEEHEEIATITEEAFIKLGMKNIWVRRLNPYQGLPDHTFSKILITGAVPFLPKIILNQVKLNGIVVFPMILTNLNHQVIYQLVQRKNQFNIINFGSVIFSHLYTKNLPQMKIKEDFTVKTLINYAKKYPEKYIFKEKPFYEEYRNLPQLNLYQIHFDSTDKIYKSYAHPEDGEFQNFLKDNLVIYIENPDSNIIEVNFILSGKKAKYYFEKKSISIYPGHNNKIRFPIEFDLKDDVEIFDLTIESVDFYRIANGKLISYLLKTGNELNVSLEFQSSF
jgi:protein-L-isoaspartate O-methyltransferase